MLAKHNSNSLLCSAYLSFFSITRARVELGQISFARVFNRSGDNYGNLFYKRNKNLYDFLNNFMRTLGKLFWSYRPE